MKMTIEEQTPLRKTLHAAITEAVNAYEKATGWKVTGMDYTPDVTNIHAEPAAQLRPPHAGGL